MRKFLVYATAAPFALLGFTVAFVGESVAFGINLCKQMISAINREEREK